MITYLAPLVAAVAAVRGMWSPCGLSMLSSLNPVSERARGNRYWATVLWYVLGATAGGAVLGGGCALAALGFGRLHLGPSWVAGLTLGAAVIAVASDAAVVPVALADHPRQVDERWLVKYRRWIYAGGYGLQIGTGFATYIMTAAVYLTAALAVLSGDPRRAFLIGLTFGLVRGLGILLTARARTPQSLRALVGRVDRLGTPALRVACATSAAVASAAVWTLAGPALAGAVAVAMLALVLAAPGRQPRRAAA